MILWEASSSEETRRTSSANCGNVLRSSIWNWPRRKLGCCSLGVLPPSNGASTDRGQRRLSFWASSTSVGRIERAVRPDPDPLHQELQKVPRSRPRVVAWTPTLEETPTTAAPHGDAARLLPVLRLHHCDRKLSWIRHEVQRHWVHALQRRGQRQRISWVYLSDRPLFALPSARTLHPAV